MRQATLPVAALSLSGNAIQLDFHQQGDWLLVRGADSKLSFWSWRDGKPVSWAEGLTGVSSAQFSPNGASVALAFRSGLAQIRSAATGKVLARIPEQGRIGALAFSPDGKYLAIASRVARVWNVSGQAFLDPVWIHPQPLSALMFNRKGDRLITTCQDKRARVFAVESAGAGQEPLYAPVVHVVPSSPALIDDDRNLVTVSGESELTRWDITTGKPVAAPIHTKPWNLQGVVASPDGNWFAAAGYYGPELYAADAKRPPVYLGHTNLVTKFVFSPDSTMLLSVSWDQTARLWSLPGGQPLGEPLKHMSNVEGCAWSHDGRYLATAQFDGLVRVWQRPVDDLVITQQSSWTPAEFRLPPRIPRDDELVIAKEPDWGLRPRVSFDGLLVVPGFWHETPNQEDGPGPNRVRVLDTANGRPVAGDITLPGPLVDSCVTGDNRAVAAVWKRGEKGQLGVWDLATQRARFEPIPLSGLALSVAARPGSGQLAVLCSNGDLLVVDDKTGACVQALRHEGWATDDRRCAPPQVRYTPDGKALVSGGGFTVNVRDADSGRLRFEPLHSSVAGSYFRSYSVSDDSRLLATMALGKNHAQVWDLATGRALSRPLPHPGGGWGLFSVRFNPDGRYLLTSHKDGQVRCWDWRSSELACPPLAHANETHDAALTHDGHYALTVVGGRPELYAWELTTGRRVAPPVRLGPIEGGWSRTLATTPDGRRALVGFSPTNTGRDLAVVDLEALLSPPSMPTADLALLSELATAERIELGDLSGLTTEQWLERWNQLRERNTDLVRSVLVKPRHAVMPKSGDP
jgi:WD40 repeat protein